MGSTRKQNIVDKKKTIMKKQSTFLYVFSLLLLLDPLTPFSLADDIYMKQQRVKKLNKTSLQPLAECM